MVNGCPVVVPLCQFCVAYIVCARVYICMCACVCVQVCKVNCQIRTGRLYWKGGGGGGGAKVVED